MSSNCEVEVALVTNIEKSADFTIEQTLFNLDNEMKQLSSQADRLDYLISVASGILCGMLDILWVGEFSLVTGCSIADNKIEGLIQKTAKMLGCKDGDI